MNTSQKFDYVVFIGRFQPYHLGHRSVIQNALEMAKRGVIILIGSAIGPRNIKNPFTFEERKEMIITDPYVSNHYIPLHIRPLSDSKYNNTKWITTVQELVAEVIRKPGTQWSDYPPSIAVIGLNKDESTSYLTWFPQWKSIAASDYGGLNTNYNATSIRKLLFDGSHLDFIKGVVPSSSMQVITDIIKNKPELWDTLKEEYSFIEKYKKSWEAAPYPPTFVTADAVVFQDGHVLMVKRGASPGKGLWALPGGFINQNESVFDAAIRELKEETKIKVSERTLIGSVIGEKVFDLPERSLRGRTITHAFGFRLESVGSLPKVKGSDDAAAAKWIPLAELDRSVIFEDHDDIITYFKGKI